MIDINIIRQDPEAVKSAAIAKGFHVDIDRLLDVDARRRKVLTHATSLRTLVNQLSETIPTLGSDERSKAIVRVKECKTELSVLEEEQGVLNSEFETLMLLVPNPPAPETPPGKSDADNVEIHRWGDIPQFDFQPKDHVELSSLLGLAEFERSRAYAGSRSYSLIGDGVLLERAVVQFALEHVLAKHFQAIAPPIMVREPALIGSGFFPLSTGETYALERDDLYLVGTSEVSLIAQHRDNILEADALPLRYVGVSPCFRREAGAAGRDTKGLYRVHMFTKVEQVSIGPCDEEWSREEHLMLLENSLEILRALHLPHRVTIACAGELGLGQVRKHEIESWMPSRGAYSETHSCSTLYEFQARRSKIRYRSREGPMKFVHTLNNTAIASPRILIPLVENNQTADGCVIIPPVLRKYMGNRERLEPRRR